MARLTARINLAAVLAFAAGTAFSGSALAQGSGGDGYDASFDDGVLRLKERGTGRTLVEQPQKQFSLSRISGSLSPVVDVQLVADGYDIHYSFTNGTSSAKPLPDLRVGPILLGDHVTYQDTRRSCGDIETDAATHKVPGHNYPVNMYSPVWIVRSDDHASGVSLQYPILDQRHDVKFYMRHHDASGGWLVDMRLSSNDDGVLEYSAMVPPGDTWDYTVNVRFTPKAEEWVRTLLPYREYFRAKYGGVQYERDVTPINALGLSINEAISNSNPYGFSREDMRPDHYGFGPFVDYALSRKGWPEYMIITPTGLYQRNVHLNYPFLFTSEWLARPEFETALDQSVGFPKIARSDKTLGFWWGRAAQVSYQWDANESYQLDPGNPDHVNAAMAELDRAVQAGAKTIGLDTFGYRAIPIWDSYPWLELMQQRHPDVKFVLEPMPCDIMHTKAPGWLRGFNDSQPVDTLEELNFIKGPHYLADFLLPGHETWAAWRYKGHKLYLGITPNQLMVDHDLVRFANWGYRPMLYTEFDMRVSATAAESWEYTVPGDLQINDDGSRGPNDDGRGLASGGSQGVSSRSGGPAGPRASGVSAQEASKALQRAREQGRPVIRRSTSGRE